MKFGPHTLTLAYGTTYEFTLGDLTVQAHVDCPNFMGSGHDLWQASVCFNGVPLISDEGSSGQVALDGLWEP